VTEVDERRQSWLTLMERLRVLVQEEYDVLSLLGYGGMAGVFLAVERRLQRRVALKVMSPELMLGHKMVERFEQEAVTQANLEHPSIAAVHSVREQGGLHFFAMTYVGGRTLQAAIRHELAAGRLLDPVVVTTLLHQVGSALEYAHGMGVIHRDVKPGNVLLAGDGRAIVTDFGIAKVTEGPALTAMSTVQGTASYMSPEQCYAAELTGASDQYSLGIVAYEMVAGRVPFTGDSFSIMQAHAGREPPRLEEVRPDCPPALAGAIHRMLAKEAGARFPSIAAALEAMGAVGLSPRRDDPARLEIIRLAASEEVMRELGDDVRRAMLTPRSVESVITERRPAGTPPGVPRAMTPTDVRRASSTPHSLVGSVVIAPHAVVVALGEHFALNARCLDSAGFPVQAALSWTSEPAGIVEIGTDGTAVAQQWGRARLRVSAEGRSAESEVIVGTVPIQRIEVQELAGTIRVGAEAPWTARVYDVAGRLRAIPVQAHTTDPAVAATDGHSLVRALAPGSVQLIVRCGSAEQRTTLRVVAAT
jgi:eukaryotic-like serine/threonine-protein kinase